VAHRVTTIDRTTALRAPPSLVFAVVNSPETAHLIDPAVREWSADTRPIGVGTRFTIRGRLGVVPIRGMSRVVVWDPPSVAQFRNVRPSWPVHITATHRFVERADGGTDYTWSMSFEAASIVARPLIAMMSPLFRRAMAAQGEALGRYLDQRRLDEVTPPL